MTDRRYLSLSSSDIALRLDLIHRVHGIEEAENYFNNVSNYLKTYNVYGALLSCYAQGKYVEKAEATMQKMRELDLATSSFPYNMLIKLYTETGDFDKIKNIVQEMDQKGIPQDKYTIKNQMAAHIATSDISGMERALNLAGNRFFVDWKLYSMMASGYLKLGSIEKALAMLKKMEGMIPYQKTNLAFEVLITLYASTGKKDELYRVWNTYKPSEEQINGPCASMITSLMKLDDLEGAEKVFEEWESRCTTYDFRVLNRLLVAYCRNSLFEKAEASANKAAHGRTPYASTWNILAVGYREHNQMPKAVEMLKKAISVGRQGWWPQPITLDACLDYLERQGDVSEMEDMIGLLKKLGPLNRDIYHRWLRTCVAAGGSVSEVIDQMKMDGFSADEETQEILETRPSL